MNSDRKKPVPYGITDLKQIINKNYAYADKTQFIEKLEEEENPVNLFVRPYKFGKSLFVSTLAYYYDMKETENFDKLFGDLYIGKHPTDEKNSYAVMKLDFAGIYVSDSEEFQRNLTARMYESMCNFIDRYRKYFPNSRDYIFDDKKIPDMKIIDVIFRETTINKVKIYVTIDNYDSFVDDIAATGKIPNRAMIDKLEAVRVFYEEMSAALKTSDRHRMFITGISPVLYEYFSTLFSINNISKDPLYHEMMGFTQEEYQWFRENMEFWIQEDRIILQEKLYGGYLFDDNNSNRLLHPDMVLYPQYKKDYEYMSRKYFSDSLIARYDRWLGLILDDKKYQILQDIVKNNGIKADVEQMFTDNEITDEKDFIALLFYTGLLTIDKTAFLKVPNYTARCILNSYLFEKRSRIHPEKIIFLDIDGVLQPSTQYRFEHINEIDELNQQLQKKYGVDYGVYDKYDVTAVYYDWNKKAVADLKRILDVTGAKIVVSSDWRRATLDRMVDFCTIYGFGDAIVGSTITGDIDKIKKGDEKYRKLRNPRSREILFYLETHPGIKNYVALDDMNLVTDLTDQHAIETCGYLTEQEADLCIELLKKK
ncbi:MAG: AAA family ATPase [Bacteroidales bacterium]|jgi:hypothetical protein|nr:AAA family ATPase [Bacteroidales bacterium]